ncbi:hypothetical protein [Butyrivibrio sp. M55]|uniref:hypothetical protein n=1 Tax=Butyrivibrio sp. M55 TaxID=1855323 RepID=UPI0008E45A03|nr:hypothetical protein [Butyrivibrio sp. M55]SFU69243.1 hypothetical protein SAMN05216540_10642 [Butyrivibrio sp. M55]
MNYNGILELPISCASMSEDEMTFTNGGINIGMSRGYLDKNICNEQAKGIIRTYGWTNVTAQQLAKEIYGHAYVYYNFSWLSNVPGLNKKVYDHAADGVDLVNGVDDHQAVWEFLWNF